MTLLAYQINRPAHAFPKELNSFVGLYETLEFGAIRSEFNIAAVLTIPLWQIGTATICGIKARNAGICSASVECFIVGAKVVHLLRGISESNEINFSCHY